MEAPTPKYSDDVLTGLVYEDLIELLATGGGPEAIIAYRSSSDVQDRAYDLVQLKKNNLLTDDEARELQAYHQREHILRMAKIRAHLMLQKREVA